MVGGNAPRVLVTASSLNYAGLTRGVHSLTHPVIVVRHPNGKLSLCIDMRQLDAATELEPHPIPRVEEVVNRLAEGDIFSHLDVSAGFWHAPVGSEDIPKLGFSTPWGNYAFCRMPFGLVNGPSLYQNTMDMVFDGVKESKKYIDDTFVSTKGWQKHLSALRELFSRCRKQHHTQS